MDTKIPNLPNYTTPLDADNLVVDDTANVTTKRTTWANIKATLVTYFNAIYATIASPTFTGTVTIPSPFKIGSTSVTTTGAELNNVAGTTSAIQTQINGLIPKSIVTTKGDLIVATASAALARLGVGTDGQVLSADSSQTDGLKWITNNVAQLVYSSLIATETIAASAAVATALYQTTNIGYDTSGKLATTTSSITIGVNSNRSLQVIVFAGANGGVSPIISGTYGGQAITFVNNQFPISGNGNCIAVGVLPAPPTGSNAFALSVSGAGGLINGIFYQSIYNASQATTPNAANQNCFSTVSTGSPTITVNPTVDGCVSFGVGYLGNSNNAGTPTGNIYNSNNSAVNNPAYFMGNSGVTNLFGASTNMVLSSSGATNSNWNICAISIAPISTPVAGVRNASSATTDLRNTGFVGFAQNSATIGNPIAVIAGGIVTGLSSISTGAPYYLNDINGTYGINPGTQTRKIGIGFSLTQLLITNIF